MEPEPEEADTLRKRMKRVQQRMPRARESLEIGHGRSEAPGPCNDREIAVLDLQRDGPAGNFGAFDAVPGITGDPLQLYCQPLGIAEVLVERPLGADRLVRPVGLHLAFVNAAT